MFGDVIFKVRKFFRSVNEKHEDAIPRMAHIEQSAGCEYNLSDTHHSPGGCRISI
jgi:hypothetical protein